MDDRSLGREQRLGCPRDGLWITRLAQTRRRGVIEPLGAELPQGHILRNFQQHRSRSATPQLGKSTPHEVRHPLYHINFFTSFGDRLVTARWVKIGVDATPLPCHACGQEQNRHGFGVSLATPPKPFSAPGPFCIMKTPILRPLVTRE